MIPRDSQQTDIPFTKQESTTITRSQDHDSNDHHPNAPNTFKSISSSATTSSSSSSWSRLKDPRIVRVSRAFGGKDRHSKVCTVRGLRDRRVRLSVPTAIQLYDLQDRLGLNQPSKVVDWLLEAAKHEIEELPPLQIPPGAFAAQISDQAKQSLNIFGGKLKEVSGENASTSAEFNLANNSASSMTNLLNSSGYNMRWDPSSLTLSSSAAHHPPRSTAPIEDWHNFSLVPPQPTVSHLHHHHHQVLVYQPGMSTTTQSYFPQNNNSDQFDNPNKPVNFHDSTVVESTNAAGGAHHFNMSTTANLLPSHNNEGR